MKKTLAILLAAALCLTFTGCGAANKLLSAAEEITSKLPSTGEIGSKLEEIETGLTDKEEQPEETPDEQPEIENKVELSIDKTAYEKEERIGVTLDFDKLDRENAVIVIVSADTPHGKSDAVYEDDAHEEYRYLSDFSELPFYMWAPDSDGLFDVRVFSHYENGEELGCVTFAVGSATLPG